MITFKNKLKVDIALDLLESALLMEIAESVNGINRSDVANVLGLNIPCFKGKHSGYLMTLIEERLVDKGWITSVKLDGKIHLDIT